MRDAKNAGEFLTSKSNHDEVLSAMLGNAVQNLYPPKQKNKNDQIALSLKNVTFSGTLHDISFDVLKGEIFGVFGLLGSGLENLGRNIYGFLGKNNQGDISLFGKAYSPKNTQYAKERGIGFIPAERKTEGILSELPLRSNLTIPLSTSYNLRISFIIVDLPEPVLPTIAIFWPLFWCIYLYFDE